MPAAACSAPTHTHPYAGGQSGSKPKLYNPRHPERTLLYQTIADHFETWHELASAGQLARQANGSIVCTMGSTVALGTTTVSAKPRDGVDFLPLQVVYQEKFYAGGRIPGGFFKREGRATEKETRISRPIPIAPWSS
mgnify:CR=1 FL=1